MMTRFTRDDLTPEILTSLKSAGWSDKRIADEYNMPETTVRSRRRALAVHAPLSRPRRLFITAEQFAEYKERKLSDKEIAKLHGVTESTISKWRRDAGVDALPDRPSIDDRYQKYIGRVMSMREAGYTLDQIAEKTGIPRGTIVGWLPKRLSGNSAEIDPVKGKRMLYEWILWFKSRYAGSSPSANELASLSGISVGATKRLLNGLESDGKIECIRNGNSQLRFRVVGEQWLPPVGVKVMTTPPTMDRRKHRRKKADPNRRKRKAANAYRHHDCDCGKEATAVMVAAVRLHDSKGDNNGWIVLCADCAQMAREDGERVLPLTVRSDGKE